MQCFYKDTHKPHKNYPVGQYNPNTMFYRSLHHPPNPPNRNIRPILQKTMSFSGTHYTPPPPPKLPFVIFGVLFFYLVTRRM